MTLTVIASGSSGNCSLISEGDTHLLIDAGISMRRVCAALADHGVRPEALAGVLITHEHSDHISGLAMLCKHYGPPVFAPRTVANHIRWSTAGVDEYIREIRPEEPFSLGCLRVTAFPTPHDTDESVGYRLEGQGTLGFCTDTGHVSDVMRRYLAGCDAAVVEANHDLERLRTGPYPVYLKRRVLSGRGHLSNDDCASLVCELAAGGTRSCVLAHLSRENNRPALARSAVEQALSAAGLALERLEVAPVLGDLTLEIRACSV